MNTTDYDKLRLTLRSQLMGLMALDPSYEMPIQALTFAEEIHDGFRKDGVTPEFYHQLNILGYLMTLHQMLPDPAMVYTVAILHDLYEDNQTYRTAIEQKFTRAYPLVVTISKVRDGVKLTNGQYYDGLAEDVICVIVKCADRIHNMSTMIGVFNANKIIDYVMEVNDYVLPMIKTARTKYPLYTPILQNLKMNINVIIGIINKIASQSS